MKPTVIATVCLLVGLPEYSLPANSASAQTNQTASRTASQRSVDPLGAELAAVEAELANLTNPDCALAVDWQPLLDLLRSRVGAAAAGPAAERTDLLVGLQELNTLVAVHAAYSAEACANARALAELKASARQHHEIALDVLHDVRRSIRGSGWPFDDFSGFHELHESVNWWELAGRTNSEVPADTMVWGPSTATASLRDQYDYLERAVAVFDGIVHLTVPSGQQTVEARLYKRIPKLVRGLFTILTPFGGQLPLQAHPNYVLLRVRERAFGGVILQYTVRTRCGGKTSVNRCAGSRIANFREATPRTRLSSQYERQMRRALQEYVSEACELRIANPDLLAPIFEKHRPVDERPAYVYDRAIDRLQAEMGLPTRQSLCDPASGHVLQALVEEALDHVQDQGAVRVMRELNDRTRRRLQGEFDLMIDEFVRHYALGPAYPVPPAR